MRSTVLFRQYDATDAANRLVAGELEARWNRALAHAAEVEGKIVAHDAATPAPAIDPTLLGVLASNLRTVWSAPTTDARLKKRIVRTLILEVVADIDDVASEIVLVIHLGRRRPQSSSGIISAGLHAIRCLAGTKTKLRGKF